MYEAVISGFISAEAAQALEAITAAVDSITDMNTQIASAAEEQSAVSRELERNVVNISHVATETSHGTAQIAAASTELAALAVGLQEMVGEFRVQFCGRFFKLEC